MKESFLCFESGDSLFLISISWVFRILEAPAEGQDCVMYQEREIPVQDFCRRWGANPGGKSRYAVLLREGESWESCAGFLAERILGVCELETERFKALPQEVCGEKNAFLRAAVWMEDAGRFAFLADCEELF